MSSPGGISVHITVHVAPENVDNFLAALKPVFDAVCAEPECKFFEVYQDPDEPGKLSWVENWDATKEWMLEVQVAKDYYKEYFAITEAMFLKPREIKVFNRVGAPFYMVKET